MNWSDVTKSPPERVLKQFAGLSLGFLLVAAGLRCYRGHGNVGTIALIAAALVVGIAGLVRPRTIRPVYTAAMVAAFPIGWTVSKIVLAVVFYFVFTPVSLAFRLAGRDALHLRRRPSESYWRAPRQSSGPSEYFRQT